MDHSDILGLLELVLAQSQCPGVAKRTDYVLFPNVQTPG